MLGLERDGALGAAGDGRLDLAAEALDRLRGRAVDADDTPGRRQRRLRGGGCRGCGRGRAGHGGLRLRPRVLGLAAPRRGWR